MCIIYREITFIRAKKRNRRAHPNERIDMQRKIQKGRMDIIYYRTSFVYLPFFFYLFLSISLTHSRRAFVYIFTYIQKATKQHIYNKQFERFMFVPAQQFYHRHLLHQQRASHMCVVPLCYHIGIVEKG